MVRTITISREYGSGGAAIARMLAKRLGWRLVDDRLVSKLAELPAKRPEEGAPEQWEDTWLHGLFKALWRGGFVGTATRVDREAWDAESVAQLWNALITEAAAAGNCVVVGRGGQCVLQRHEDAFHVHIYAPAAERVRRIRERMPQGSDAAELIRERDQRRYEYIRHYFGQNWNNPHLYHMMLCSSIGFERATAAILCGSGLAGVAL
jgi:cytidylate kinase